MKQIEKVLITETHAQFYSTIEERHYKLTTYQNHIIDYAQKIYTDANVSDWELETIRQTLYNDGLLSEFETLFTSQNDGLVFFRGKSKLVSISLPLCRDLTTLKTGKEIDYSLYTALLENGLSGKFFRNFTNGQKKPEVGMVYEFEYMETLGRYDNKNKRFFVNRNVKVIMPKKQGKKQFAKVA